MKTIIRRATAVFAVLALTAVALLAVGTATEQKAEAAPGFDATLQCWTQLQFAAIGDVCFAQQGPNYAQVGNPYSMWIRQTWNGSGNWAYYAGDVTLMRGQPGTGLPTTQNRDQLRATSGSSIWITLDGGTQFVWGWSTMIAGALNSYNGLPNIALNFSTGWGPVYLQPQVGNKVWIKW